jgi:hypothetical protein
VIREYAKVYNLGHKAIAELFADPVVIEEKVDGSQFSFGIIDGELQCRSKGAIIQLDSPPKMFAEGVEYVRSIEGKLVPGWTYRAEYLQRPKHNVLAYDRIPTNHLMLFDIDFGVENYCEPLTKAGVASCLGIEAVPCLYEGKVDSLAQINAFLETRSVLGGQLVEGVVIKNPHRFGVDKKMLAGKLVREAFKEMHAHEWKGEPKAEFIENLARRFCTEARWEKAVQHLRDEGKIEDSMRDMRFLVDEVKADVQAECLDDIKDALYAHFRKDLDRLYTRGLAEWYKERLAIRQWAVSAVA